MKSLLILISLCSVLLLSAQSYCAPGIVSKTEVVEFKNQGVFDSTKDSASTQKSLVAEAFELIKSDSALQADLIDKVKTAYENRPEKGAGTKAWLIAIFTLVIGILGAIVSKMHLKKSYWYLQIIQVVGRFIINHLLAPDNKKTNGENYKV